MATPPDVVELSADFKAYHERVTKNLAAVPKTCGHLASQDLSFHRSSSDKVSKSLDQQTAHLLRLTNKLLKFAAKDTNVPAPSLKDIDSIDDNWSKTVDLVDDVLEKADASLDEFTGVIKRMSPAAQNTPPPTKAQMPPKPYARFPKVTEKPQTLFNRQVNNFDTQPFKPLLIHKPHAVKSLEESIGDGIDGYNHPYATEIEQYAYPSNVYESSPPVPFTPPESSPAIFVDTEDGMIQMMKELRSAKEIAIDLEHHDYRSYVGIVCLMQISSRNKDWIVDTLKPWREKLQLLNEVFADPNILKVFHGSSMDIIWLQRDLGLYVVGLFDTYHASDSLNLPGKGLKYLLQRFINFEAQKQYQLADWRMRPLPAELIDYARSDTHYLLNIYDQLRNMLIENSAPGNNLIDYVLEESKKEALQVYKNFVYDRESGRGSHGWFGLFTEQARDFDNQQFAVFRGIHEWRDMKARQFDESPHYLISNKALWTLAQFMPTNMTHLHSYCKPVPYFVPENFKEFQDVVHKAKREGQGDPPPHEMIKQNEEKYGVVRNRWRKSKDTPKPRHDGIGATLNQLRVNGGLTGTPTQSAPGGPSGASPPPVLERSQQSDFWGLMMAATAINERLQSTAAAAAAMNMVLPSATSQNDFPHEESDRRSLGNLPKSPAELMQGITLSTPAQELPERSNGVFILKEQGRGRKRKASEPIDVDVQDDLPFTNGDTSPAQPSDAEIQARKLTKKQKKAEKRAKKEAKRAADEARASTTVPFEYAAQTSMLTAPQQGFPTNGGSIPTSLPMNPFAKALDTGTGARRNKMGKELKGKSMTFQS